MPTVPPQTTPGPAALRGRPRDPARDEAILHAAVALIGELGYDRATIDAIAERAGVSKPTIYRRWPGKAELFADAIRRHKERRPAADTGTLRGDLLAAVGTLCASISDEQAHLAIGLAGQLRASEELASLFREHVIAVERARWTAIVQRAVARDELPAEPPVSALFGELAPAIVFTRALFGLEEVDAAFVDELVDRILLPILASPNPDR